MSIRSTRFAVVAAVAATAALVLAGCAPEPTPSSSPTVSAQAESPSPSAPSAEPSIADVDRISLSVSSFTLYAGETQVAALSTDDATIDTTIDALTEALGEPQVETASDEPSECAVPNVTYSWGDALRVLDYTEGPGFDTATIRFLAATVPSASGADVALEGGSGITVGDDIATLIEDTPSTDKDSYEVDGESFFTVLLERDDRIEDSTGGLWGLGAATEGSTVTVIGAPMNVHSGVDC